MSGGTDNHLNLINLTDKNLTGKEAEAILGEVGITVNKMSIDISEVKTDVKHITHRVSQIENKMLGSTYIPDEIYAKNPGEF